MSTSQHALNTKTGNQRRASTASQAGSEGVPVRTLKTPARSQTNMADAAAVMNQLENLKIDPGKGLTVDEMLERMNPEDREAYLLKKQAARAGYAHVLPPEPTPARKPVGRVKTGNTSTASEGMTAKQSVGGGIETWDSGDAEVVGSVVSVSTVDQEGIKFANTNIPNGNGKSHAPKKMVAKGKPAGSAPALTAEMRVRIAKVMCPDFPDSYDFGAPMKKKLARLQADFDDRLDILRAVFAAEEDDEFKAQLVQEFPQAFA
jgi:hypothetical protein